MPALEAIAVALASISAAKDGIDLWDRSRDRKQAAAAIDAGVAAHLQTATVAAQRIRQVKAFVDHDELLDIFTSRSSRCFDRLKEILNGDLPEHIVNDGIRAFRECVCREMHKLKSFGPLPTEWLGTWDEYNCQYMSLPRY